MIGDGEPRREGAVQLGQTENIAGPDFRLELILGGLNESFNDSPRRRIALGSINQARVHFVTGRPKSLGMVDLGVVQIDFQRRAVNGEGANQGVDENVHVLPKVIPGGYGIAAVALDKSR